jgi:hypothetical protein
VVQRQPPLRQLRAEHSRKLLCYSFWTVEIRRGLYRGIVTASTSAGGALLSDASVVEDVLTGTIAAGCSVNATGAQPAFGPSDVHH